MAYELQWKREGPCLCWYHQFRGADDQNEVIVLQDVADVAKARTWLGSEDLKATMQKSGVIGSSSIRFAA